MEANDLFLFARIVDAGSFSMAAERVGLPKSTVSRRLAQLETQLGERLLTRTTRKLVLTEFGQSLLEHARKVAEEVEAAGAMALHRQQEPSGRLRISSPPDFFQLGLGHMVSHFLDKYPQIVLELDLSPRRVDLVAEDFDIAIRMGDLPDDANLSARRIIEQHWALYAAPSYLAQRGVPEHPDDLLKHSLLCVLSRNGGPVSWSLTRGKVTWQRALPARLCVNSPGMLTTQAAAGKGIVASTTIFAQGFVERGELVRVLPEWEMPSAIGWAVFKGRKLMPAKTRAFLDMLTSECLDAVMRAATEKKDEAKPAARAHTKKVGVA